MLICSCFLPASAVSEDYGNQSAFENIKNSYVKLCDEMSATASDDEIFKLFLAQNPSLEVVNSSTSYFNENGVQVLPTRCQPTQLNMLKDSFVFDNDSQQYVYFGYWQWRNKDIHLKRCDDIIAFLSSEKNPNQYYYENPKNGNSAYSIYGYNLNGDRVATYDPMNNNFNKISKIRLTGGDEYGAAFYIDDSVVYEGRVVVSVAFPTGTVTHMHTAYQHNWSTFDVTNLGIDVSLLEKSLSISGSWETGVEHWDYPIESVGAKLDTRI